MVLRCYCWLARFVNCCLVGASGSASGGWRAFECSEVLLLAAAIPMHWIVLLTPMPHKPIAIVAILTIYHNFQYHRLIWFHNKKYKSSDDGRAKYGAAELISRRLIFYIAFGVLFGLLYQGPRQFLGYLNFKNGAAGIADVSFATQLGDFISLGLRVHPLLPRFKDLASAPRSKRWQSTKYGLGSCQWSVVRCQSQGSNNRPLTTDQVSTVKKVSTDYADYTDSNQCRHVKLLRLFKYST